MRQGCLAEGQDTEQSSRPPAATPFFRFGTSGGTHPPSTSRSTASRCCVPAPIAAEEGVSVRAHRLVTQVPHGNGEMVSHKISSTSKRAGGQPPFQATTAAARPQASQPQTIARPAATKCAPPGANKASAIVKAPEDGTAPGSAFD
jgi:hypothetical protein